jgi:lipopolysaccharide transport system permease protein
VLVGFVDFLIAFGFQAGMMVWSGYAVDWRVSILPLFTLWAVVAAGGAGLWLAALTVRYRDFRYIVPFLVQFGLYVSPVGFSSDIVPEKWRLLYSLNPMVGVIDGFRWAILSGKTELYIPGMTLSIGLSLALFISGIWYFRKTERTFADII